MATVQPVSRGGIPPSLPAIQIKLTFKEGGAFDYHTCFERIKERHQQAVDISRENNLRTIDLSSIDLEQLPAYEGPRDGATHHSHRQQDTSSNSHQNPGAPHEASSEPVDPPPGYEEVQQQSVASELENRLRSSSQEE